MIAEKRELFELRHKLQSTSFKPLKPEAAIKKSCAQMNQ
jgi:hypothetical protein